VRLLSQSNILFKHTDAFAGTVESGMRKGAAEKRGQQGFFFLAAMLAETPTELVLEKSNVAL